MNKTKKRIALAITAAFGLIAVALLFLIHTYLFIGTTSKKCRIGIIDYNLSQTYDNVFLINGSERLSEEKTHGDEMIQFAREYAPNAQIYYCNALSDDGKIHSDNIISALEWMKDNDIKYVNISLSTARYNPQLDEWISNNKDINIYSSYSNLEQSADYPSMYDNVIASGIENNIPKKTIDLIYKSNKIKFRHSLLKTHQGNSYLSVYSTINAANE